MLVLPQNRAALAHKRNSFGFTIIELMIVVAVLGIVATIAVLGLGRLERNVSESKSDQNIATINRAISIYLSNGGSLDGIEDPVQVVEKLKTVRSADASKVFVGTAGGSVIEPDLQFVPYDEGDVRFGAQWDLSQKKFVSAKGGGKDLVGEFVHQASTIAQNPKEEARTNSAVSYSNESGWIWDYTESDAPENEGPTEIPVAKVDDPGLPPAVTPPVSLPPPDPPVEEPEEEPEPELKTVKITFTQNSGSAWALNTAHIIVDGQAYQLGDSDGGSGSTMSVDVEVDSKKVTEIGLAVFTIGRLKDAAGGFSFAGGSGYSVNTQNGDTILQISPGDSFEGESSARAKFKSYGSNGQKLNIEVGVEDAFALDPSVFGVDYDYNDFCFSIQADKPFPLRFAGTLIE